MNNAKSKAVVEKIRAHDLAIGTLANEAIESAKGERYMAALACLFILAEQSVKLANNESSGNFKKQISFLLEKKIISEKDATVLNSLREIRNAIFHENHYMWVIETQAGKVSFFSEHEAKQSLWKTFSYPVFKICHSLVKPV